MKKILLFRNSFIVSALLALSSCATVFNGGDPLVTIEGDIDKPVTIVTEKGVYRDVTLPVEVKVSHRGIKGQHIQVLSEEHEFDDIVMEKKLTGWTAANLFIPLGEIPGFIIDWCTNSNVTPRHTHFLIKPKGEGELYRSTEPFRTDIPVNRPHAKEFYRHEVSVNIGAGGTIEDVYYDAVDKHVTPYGFEDSYIDFSSSQAYFPLSIDYMYNLNRRLAVGISIGKGHCSEDMDRTIWTEIDNDWLAEFYDSKPECRSFHVLPSVRYKWWISHNNRYAAYSQLALGYAKTKFSVDEVKDEEGKVLLPAYNTTKHLGYQITFAGVEFGRGHLRSFLELGYGYKGVFNTGIKVCF